ncbi:hypothetical protein [Rhodobium gokarnense]|uniref:Uncharacterized protein n=1 Tax=Rhodobium gokarnense TaxID=364296 RepID=A0ABT3HH31_9HYPH|nr:hypothetical protein [Rhodobium gokarnense]MCW2309703.1 hypothetical protein [Rhodobium gokarnense]
MAKRVVIWQDGDRWLTVFADEGVEVFWVDEGAKADRTYKMTPSPVPEGLLDDEYGYADDGSAASIRANRAMAAIEGRPFLQAVRKDEKSREEGECGDDGPEAA